MVVLESIIGNKKEKERERNQIDWRLDYWRERFTKNGKTAAKRAACQEKESTEKLNISVIVVALLIEVVMATVIQSYAALNGNVLLITAAEA